MSCAEQRALRVRPSDGAGRTAPLVVTPKAGPQGTPAPLATQLTLVGHVLSPLVDGQAVQANDIDFDPVSRIAVVGYNLAGGRFPLALYK